MSLTGRTEQDEPRGETTAGPRDGARVAGRADVDGAAGDREYRLPPGPKTPALFNGIAFLSARPRLMHRFRRRYGDAFTVRMPALGRMVVLSHPELIKQVFTAPPDVLYGGINPLGEMLGPGSLFSMDEDEHLEERRMLLPSFHGDRMRSYESLIEEEALRRMDEWPEGEEFATLDSFQAITLRVILRAIFGAKGAELRDLEELMPPFTALGQRLVTFKLLRRNLGPWSPGGRFRRMSERYRALVDDLITEHLADPRLEERIDILALMLVAARERGEIDRSALGDELLTLLVAGHETTASALAWSVERLRRHPSALRRLEEEAAGEGSTLRLATINEVLRVRPVIGGTVRVAVKPFELGEWLIPPGTVLSPSAALTHVDERFHPGAETFEPDRYVGRKPDTYAWIPFGGGTRRCLGAAFAQFEMDIVLRTMLRRFELVPTEAPAEELSFRGVAFAPAKGGRAVVRRRPAPLAPRRDEAPAPALA